MRCTRSEFEALEDAEETQLLPGANGQWGYDQNQMFSLPYYGLASGGLGGMGMGGMYGSGINGMGAGAGPHEIISDRVLTGDVPPMARRPRS